VIPRTGALRPGAYDRASIERRDQMFLRIGKPAGAAEFARFVDVDREPNVALFSADLEALDFCMAPAVAPAKSWRRAIWSWLLRRPA
jgi:hypothetical protein